MKNSLPRNSKSVVPTQQTRLQVQVTQKKLTPTRTRKNTRPISSFLYFVFIGCDCTFSEMLARILKDISRVYCHSSVSTKSECRPKATFSFY